MTNEYDMYWSLDCKWYHFENMIPVIDDGAPEEVKESFDNYLEQLGEDFKSDLEAQQQLHGNEKTTAE